MSLALRVRAGEGDGEGARSEGRETGFFNEISSLSAIMRVMKTESVNVWRATLLLLGTIVGAGIFAVPAMIGLWGIIPSTIAFIILTGMLVAVHLYYGEAILRSKKKNTHIMGVATRWLGPVAGHAAGAIQSLQVFGSCLAYLILGGQFLSLLTAPLQIPLLYWQVLFWVLGACIVLFGIKMVSRAETIFTWALMGVIGIIVILFASRADFSLVLQMPTNGGGFEPYGVFLFALLGIVSMPEAAELVRYDSKRLRSAIIRSTVLAAVLTYAYGVTAWMASGGDLTKDTLGVIAYLPAVLSWLIPLFGFLAIITSFISSSLDLRNLMQRDVHATPFVSGLIALGVPLALLFLTPRDFLSTVGFVGSLFGAGIAILAIWMGRAAILNTRHTHDAKNGTLLLQTEIIPWLITMAFVLSSLLWLISPSSV
jgi:amino acid permease